MINKNRLINLTQRLIRIDSQNPPGNEERIALFVKDYLKGLGLGVKTYEFKRKRTNIIATLAGKNKKHTLLLTPHLDTVPAGKSWSFPPFAATVYKNKIYGLGATDCKGNLACGLEAVKSLVEERAVLDYNLTFAATADEESGSELGLAPLLEKGILRADAAVVLDADDFSIIVAQKGLLHLKIKIQGKRAHGAYPWQGVNAIDIAVAAIRDLKKYRPDYIKNKYLRPPTMNVGTICGGDKVNIVADYCQIELDFRFLPGQRSGDIVKRVKGVLEKYTRKFSLEIEGAQKPYLIKEEHPLVSGLAEAIRAIGLKPIVKGSQGATVISFFQEKKIPAVATGFGSAGCAHTTDEHVKIDNLYQGAAVLERFLKNYRFS